MKVHEVLCKNPWDCKTQEATCISDRPAEIRFILNIFITVLSVLTQQLKINKSLKLGNISFLYKIILQLSNESSSTKTTTLLTGFFNCFSSILLQKFRGFDFQT